MSIILGLNSFHADSSAAVVCDGKLIAAAEEERFRRIKHWAGFPDKSISYCLQEAGIRLDDVDVIAINQDSGANIIRKITYSLLTRPDIGLICTKIRNRRKRRNINELLKSRFLDQEFHGRIYNIEHHSAHLSSAFHVSPFDEAVVVSVDGFGDFSSGAWGIGHGEEIEIDGRVYFPHSMGIFYQALTQYLGFPDYGDEYKVMGLAPYGRPEYMEQMYDIVMLDNNGEYRLNLDIFKHHNSNVAYQWENGVPQFGNLFSGRLSDLLGPSRKPDEELLQRHFDIARSVQELYESVLFNMLNSLHGKYQINNLALAGGCAMNSVANGKIYRNTPFKKVYIQPAAGDAGGAIGAAFAALFKLNPGHRRRFRMDHAYWGPAFDNENIGTILDGRSSELANSGCKVELIKDEESLLLRTAGAIAEGCVIGWFQGRMEWGPRALGNRSILCDPRRSDMKEILNNKIKRRESFRPFAPSILREYVSDWFDEDDDVPFMMKVFQVRKAQQSVIPAVTHVDGSGRLQTVYRETNPRYYNLIRSFQKITDVPILLNTSFNENEPIVCRPEEALDCFLRTKMDMLVMENYIVQRLRG